MHIHTQRTHLALSCYLWFACPSFLLSFFFYLYLCFCVKCFLTNLFDKSTWGINWTWRANESKRTEAEAKGRIDRTATDRWQESDRKHKMRIRWAGEQWWSERERRGDRLLQKNPQTKEFWKVNSLLRTPRKDDHVTSSIDKTCTWQCNSIVVSLELMCRWLL